MAIALRAGSWTADNGSGTYTNPLLYDDGRIHAIFNYGGVRMIGLRPG